MFRLITTLAIAMSSMCAFAQSGEDHMKEVYSTSELTNLKSTNPARYNTILAYSEKGFILTRQAKANIEYIEVSELYKADKVTPWNTEDFLTEMEKEGFNPLNLHWRPGMQKQYYHLQNSNLFFEIPSTKELK